LSFLDVEPSHKGGVVVETRKVARQVLFADAMAKRILEWRLLPRSYHNRSNCDAYTTRTAEVTQHPDYADVWKSLIISVIEPEDAGRVGIGSSKHREC
jgi:hypothetical protein